MKRVISKFGRLACFMWLCSGVVAGAFAASSDIGVVMNVEGQLTAKGTDGAIRPLGTWGKVLVGDTLFTGRDTYARVKFSDGGQILLRPLSQFKIEDYHHDEQEPGKDAAKFDLLKGGLRAISGLIGKRGDPDSYGVKTQAATVGIRGTRFGVLFCQGDCDDHPPATDGNTPADGLHLDVAEGTVIVKNPAGTQLLNAGQFGFVENIKTPPALVPAKRGVTVYVPGSISIEKVRGDNSEEGNVCPL